MKSVRMYTTPICPYCVRAKSLFKKKGVTVEEVDVLMDVAAREEMEANTGGARTVPQIFIGERHIGGFDETLLTNEDYEFNTRVRQSGSVVWLDPQIRSIYFARSSFQELARQYWRYGFWKWRMLKRYTNTVRWRQALPPLFVASLIALIFLSFWFSFARWLLSLEIILYLFILIAASVRVALRDHKPFLIAGLPLSILIMHLAWGSGFLFSLISSPLIQNHG